MEEINTMKLKDNEDRNYDLKKDKINRLPMSIKNNDFNMYNNYTAKYSESENMKLQPNLNF